MPQAKVAVIGGTGLYDVAGLTGVEEADIDTPFGKPSDAITIGRLDGTGVAFLPRHGKGHRISPTEVPSRANIYALKSLGVEHIIAVNAVGSLKEDLKPGHLLIPDQLIDRTSQRQGTFFGEGIVAHIPFSEPFCPALSQVLYQSAQEAGAIVHRGGIYVVMEGPAFSTRAESFLHRAWGAAVIGMTALPEAKLAREAEICYSIIACVTDYDCWQDMCEAVTVDAILDILRKNDEITRKIIKLATGRMPSRSDCACGSALKTAIVTDPKAIPAEQKEKLNLIIGKYIRKV